MNRIKILPENIANKIAAGEVVERPASVVKELVENSIDAGATKIVVEIKSGGVSLIRVSDDGCGMSRDDALLSLERHATSKIRDVDDIYAIKSLGFRGEALPSIASVSRFELLTSEGDIGAGTSIRIEGGKILDIKDAGLARGTIITVQDLFYNVPARRKFLKSNQTETSHIINLMTLNALPYPEVAFKLIDNGKEVFSIEKGMDLKARIGVLFGHDFADALLPVDWKSLEMRIGGFISKPEFTFSNKSKEYFFVNNRASQNKTLLFAVSEGYRTLMPAGRNPFCFLFISVDPSKVDVNIHPTKRDVRFVNEAAARDAVVSAVRSSLDLFYDMPAFAANKVTVETPRPESGVKDALGRFFDSQAAGPVDRAHKRPALSSAISFQEHKRPEAEPLPRGDIQVIPFVLGQTNKLYILAETPDGIVIIDQHAAHERVLYERTMAAIGGGRLDIQKLLLPVTVELPKAQAAFVSQHIGTMERVGIGISSFGQDSFIIDAVPAFAQMGDVKGMFLDALAELEEESKTTKTIEAFEEKMVRTLCRQAVKARDRLDMKEQISLVQDLFACAIPHTCPHGRPTMIKITNDYLEREFKRR